MKRFKYSAYLTIVLAILVMTMTSLSFYPVIRADGSVTGEAHEPGGAAGNYDDNTTGGGVPWKTRHMLLKILTAKVNSVMMKGQDGIKF